MMALRNPIPWQEIREGGKLLYVADFYAKQRADTLFAWLINKLPWQQEKMWGRPVPRLNAWFADEGLKYTYSGIPHVGVGWTPAMATVRDQVSEACDTRFNSLLLNRYRSGQDSMGFHTDAEPELGADPVVATLSLGAEREFILRHPPTRNRLKYRLQHGSLLVMAGTTQHHWEHAVLKTKEQVGERISLTFREILAKDDPRRVAAGRGRKDRRDDSA